MDKYSKFYEIYRTSMSEPDDMYVVTGEGRRRQDHSKSVPDLTSEMEDVAKEIRENAKKLEEFWAQ